MILNVFWMGLKYKHVKLFYRSKATQLNDLTCFFLLLLYIIYIVMLFYSKSLRGTKKGVKSLSKGQLIGVEALNVFFQKGVKSLIKSQYWGVNVEYLL